MANHTIEGSSKFVLTGEEVLPETVDWRLKDIVTEVKNQVCHFMPVYVRMCK